jgi:hypothetical protein
MARQKVKTRFRPGLVSLDIGPDARQALDALTEAAQEKNPRRNVTKTEVLRDLILDAVESS